MCGDFENAVNSFSHLLQENQLNQPPGGSLALDLGCGHGIQSVALARNGYRVTAVDLSISLLDELQRLKGDLHIHTSCDNLLNIAAYSTPAPTLICCGGDTLSHLATVDELVLLINRCFTALKPGGTLLFTYRDYSTALYGNDRFIPVKSDDTRLLTCFLEYETDRVKVNDLLYEKKDGIWKQSVSAYYKLRLNPGFIAEALTSARFSLLKHAPQNRLYLSLAQKPLL